MWENWVPENMKCHKATRDLCYALYTFALCQSFSSGEQCLDCPLQVDYVLPDLKVYQILETSWLYDALLKKLMSKAVSISHFNQSQSSGLWRLLHHPLEIAGFNELDGTKLRLKSSRLSSSFLESLPIAGPRSKVRISPLPEAEWET